MNREKVKRVEAQFAPPIQKCIVFIQDGREPEQGINCHYAEATIPYDECPGYNGHECPYCQEFVKVNIARVRAGPNGEVQRYGSPEWPFEDDDDSETPIEKEG